MRIKLIITIVLLSFTSIFLSANSYDEMTNEAMNLFEEKKYQEAAEMIERTFKIDKPQVDDYINAAFFWALAENKENTLKNIEKGIEAGWLNADWLETNPTFMLVQEDKMFIELIAKINENKEKLIQTLPTLHPENILIELPEPKFDSNFSIERTLKERRSTRSYLDAPLTLAELSQILWAAYGVTYFVEDMPEFLRGGLKTAPSAGALYPLDIYVVVSNVSELEKGVYKYKPEGHKLILIGTEDVKQKLLECAYGQTMVEEASASLVYSAIFSRTTEKYGDRGRERYVCMDLGHSAENVYLQAVSLNIGTCAIGAFDDLKLRMLINMTQQEEPLYIMPLGKLQKIEE